MRTFYGVCNALGGGYRLFETLTIRKEKKSNGMSLWVTVYINNKIPIVVKGDMK